VTSNQPKSNNILLDQVLQVPKPTGNEPQLAAATYGIRLRTLITTYYLLQHSGVHIIL